MISLYNTLKESLLSDFDNIEASMDPIKDIEQFIRDNYKIAGELQISKEPNENGKYEVSCKDVGVKNKNITSLTNNLFEWEKVKSNFSRRDCSLTSLEGAPKEVGGYFDCIDCPSLKSLEGAPETVGANFYCSYCTSLTSLEGAPKKVDGSFDCGYCTSLKSLEGAPKKVRGSFSCSGCVSLRSLEGAPKEVGKNFYCKGLYRGCGKQFTEEDVKKVCNTAKIYV